MDLSTLEERLRVVEVRSEQLLEVRVWREKLLLAVVAFLVGALMTGLAAGVPHSHRLAIIEERQNTLVSQVSHLQQHVQYLYRKQEHMPPRLPLPGEDAQ